LLRNLCWLRCTVALHHLTLTELEGLKESNLAPHAELPKSVQHHCCQRNLELHALIGKEFIRLPTSKKLKKDAKKKMKQFETSKLHLIAPCISLL